MSEDYIKSRISELRSREGKLVVWPGAGISADSGVPVGNSLTDYIIARTYSTLEPRFKRDVVAEIKWVYQRIFGDDRPFPRLEFVMGKLRTVLGEGPFNTLMSLFADFSPNSAHKQLASWANDGVTIITPNFDKLIETAGAPAEQVHHYHRTYDDEDVGVTINAIAQGFVPDWDDRLRRLLHESECVLFIGYSGSDFYDVERVFAESDEGVFREAIWLDHQNGKEIFEARAIPERLMPYQHAFREFRLFKGDTRKLFSDEDAQPNSTKWHERVDECFNLAPLPQRLFLGLQLLYDMTLTELAQEFLDYLRLFYGNVLDAPADSAEVARYDIVVSHQRSHFRTCLKYIEDAERSGKLSDDFTYRYFASCSLFGYQFFGMIRSVLRTCRLEKRIEEMERTAEAMADAHAPSGEKEKIILRILRFHEELHIYPRLLQIIPKRIRDSCCWLLCLLGFTAFVKHDSLRGRLKRLYESIGLYQEEAWLQFAYEAPKDPTRDWPLMRRYVETDSLGMYLVSQRADLQSVLRECDTSKGWDNLTPDDLPAYVRDRCKKRETRPCEEKPEENDADGPSARRLVLAEVKNNIGIAYAIGQWYELLCWVAMGQVLFTERKERAYWRVLEASALKQIELTQLGKIALPLANRIRARSRMGF